MQEIWEYRILMSYQENACIFTRDILMRTIKPCLSTKILRVGPSNHVKSESMIEILITWPENAKLESARPLVRKATVSQGGSPRSTEDSIMKIAGETKAIVWHIFRTYIFKKHIQIFNSTFFFCELAENTIMIYNTTYTMFTPENCQGFLLRKLAEAIWELSGLPVLEFDASSRGW